MSDLAVLDGLQPHLLAISAVDHVEIHVKLGGHGLVHNLDFTIKCFGSVYSNFGARRSLVHNLGQTQLRPQSGIEKTSYRLDGIHSAVLERAQASEETEVEIRDGNADILRVYVSGFWV